MNFLLAGEMIRQSVFCVLCALNCAQHTYKNKQNTHNYTCIVRDFLFAHHHHHDLLFTDLSAAGLPAELKHITQRRKRKQP